MRSSLCILLLCQLLFTSCRTYGEPFEFAAVWDLTRGETTLAEAAHALGRAPDGSDPNEYFTGIYGESFEPSQREFLWSRGIMNFGGTPAEFEWVLLRFDSQGVLKDEPIFRRKDPDRKPMRMSAERLVALNDDFEGLTPDRGELRRAWGLWDLPPDHVDEWRREAFTEMGEWPGGGLIAYWRSQGLHGSAADLNVLFDPAGKPHSFVVDYSVVNHNTSAPERDLLQRLVDEGAPLREVLERVEEQPDSLVRLPNGEVRILWRNGLLYTELGTSVLVLSRAGECERVFFPVPAPGNALYFDE